MSRYIDADKLLNPDNIIVMQDETGIDEFPYTYTNAVKVETILKAHTADVVAVVRCRDCKHIESTEYGGYCCLKKIGVAYNDYCSYGERKEE